MNSKTAFKNTIKLMNSERPVFVPFVYGLAARIGQIPLQEMVSDAGYYSHSLEEARDLFKYDGIVNHFDATIEAEVFGCDVEWPDDYTAPRVSGCRQVELREANPEESGRIQTLLEATKRTVMSRGRDVAIIGTITGPVSLVKALLGDNSANTENAIAFTGGFLTKLVKSLCELRVDSIFFREDPIGAGYRDELLSHQKPYADIYTTLFNLVKYYNGSPLLIVKDMEMDFISDLHRSIAPGGLILLGKRFSEDDLAYLQKLSDSLKISFGLPLALKDTSELWEQFAVISQYASKHRPAGFFYVSDGDVPYDTSPEVLHELIAKIQNG
ncbi:MAG TPA: uroporphyrinogen decarboxylase family protein [Dehalococcoidales bacterium]|nr:uroporphyrinogen decarboxylase family protein [Dehalococcoidales bacterium]